MTLNFRFAIASDLHIALPHTIWDHPSRFHLVEVSIPALELVLEHLGQLDLDFLLLPGDLTQHGEWENHTWLETRLSQLPYPVYVIPGNHDVPVAVSDGGRASLADFPYFYRKFGYENPEQIYYSREILPGVRLIGLNSNQFDTNGQQVGRLDIPQLLWLEETLATAQEEVILVTVHHNLIEHLPNQANHPLGRRYILENAKTVLRLLHKAGVNFVFTGHLHIQDIACDRQIYDITTGSLVSYPHPYRILQFQQDENGKQRLKIESHRIESVANFPTLADHSREWMGDRSYPFMLRLLTDPPCHLSRAEAEELIGSLRYFWADIAQGDTVFHFPHFPPATRRYFESFGAVGDDGIPTAIDNHTTLIVD